MTDHTGRAGLEREELYAIAHEFDELRTDISVPGAPSGLPNLTTASKQLATLLPPPHTALTCAVYTKYPA